MSSLTTRKLPDQGRASPRFGHLGVWNLSLGPNSPIPGDRLRVCILDQDRVMVRRFEQIEGRCIDEGYVDFFLSNNCRPAVHERPIVDIDQPGKIAAVLCPDYRQEMGMELYLKLLGCWAEKWGRQEYAL